MPSRATVVAVGVRFNELGQVLKTLTLTLALSLALALALALTPTPTLQTLTLHSLTKPKP